MSEYRRMSDIQRRHLEQKLEAREVLLQRANSTVRDPVVLELKSSGRAIRMMYSDLNATIGMNAYEIIFTGDADEEGNVKVEVVVPADMALMLKLRWSNL